MIKALQSSGRAMAVQLQRHELIANNLANVNTPGFQQLISRVKSQYTTSPGAGPGLSGTRNLEVIVDSIQNNNGGPLRATGNPLDVALVGEGYFTVDTPDGVKLSRDGSFSLNEQGELIHSSGYPVLADGSTVVITREASILQDGTIMDGDQALGRISVVRPMGEGSLRREGDNLLSATAGIEQAPPEEINIMSGHLEGSNVNAIEEMVSMIKAFRAYETAQKAAQAADETLRTAVERVGVVRA
jgi:flagellar basal-body rod protein FlgF